MVPNIASMVVMPAATPDANPEEEIVAILVFDELQVIDPVIFCVVLSAYVPIAANCCVAPAMILGVDGVTAMETNVDVCPDIVKVVEPEMRPDIAATLVVPALIAVARPAFERLAMLVFDELHVTDPVISCLVLSEYVPVAANCCDAPVGMEGSAGVIAIAVNAAPLLFIDAGFPHPSKPIASIEQTKPLTIMFLIRHPSCRLVSGFEKQVE
jgi:hypothetical protein